MNPVLARALSATAFLLAVVLAAPAAPARPARLPASDPMITHGAPDAPKAVPVLLVHGIDDRASVFDTMRHALWHAGIREMAVFDMLPNNGDEGLDVLAAQVKTAAAKLRAETGADKVDVVAFSMGALVTRYWIQKLGGKAHVRRFVSISGPQHGTLAAFFRFNRGAEQMRTGSAFLTDLEADPDPWGDVRVHSMMTALDLIILPFNSSVIDGAETEDVYFVPAHPLMLIVPDVSARIIGLLKTPVAAGLADDAPTKANEMQNKRLAKAQTRPRPL